MTPAGSGAAVRWSLLGTLAVTVALAGATSVLAAEALRARDELLAAHPAVEAARAATLTGDVDAALRELSALQAHTAVARSATDGPLWGAAAHVPWVGDDVDAVRAIAVQLDVVATEVLPPLLDTSARLRPEALLSEDNRLDVAPLLAAQPVLDDAEQRSTAAARRVGAIPTTGLLPQVRDAVVAVEAAAADLRSLVGTAAVTARILPPLLGAEEPRRYLVSFQNPAEARGTGGIIGAYGVLEAEQGRIRVRELGPNGDLKSPPRLPFEPGPGYRTLYSEDPALWSNVNMSPHFPHAARLMLAAWERQFGEELDGVLATDPVALGYLLGATGPVTLPNGDRVDAGNAAELTMSGAYRRYPESADSPERDAYLQRVGAAAFATVLSGAGDPSALGQAVARATAEHRLMAYSRDEALQQDIAGTALAGTLPDGEEPFLGVVVNQGRANKIDYFLERRVTYTLGPCGDAGTRRSRAKIVLRNDAPTSGLPPYVTGAASGSEGTQRLTGYSRLLVYVHTTAGAVLDTARLDGTPVVFTQGEERGRPVYRFAVDIPPQRSRTLSLDLLERARPGRPVVWEQPLARHQATEVTAAACRPAT